jgi:DNA-binding transcriptional MerR regulator
MSDSRSDARANQEGEKAPDAFRTISEVAEDLDLPQHVLRFWETRFSQIKPLKRGGGRRYYRPQDVDLLRGIRHLLYGEGYTIRGVQRILREQGLRFVVAASHGAIETSIAPQEGDEEEEAPRRAPLGDDEEGAKRMAERLAGGRAEPAAPSPTPSAMASLTSDEARRLEATLSELLECKRLLDQVR